jgi:hypothetical protein
MRICNRYGLEAAMRLSQQKLWSKYAMAAAKLAPDNSLLTVYQTLIGQKNCSLGELRLFATDPRIGYRRREGAFHA